MANTFLEQKNNCKALPSANKKALFARAKLNQDIRDFFSERGILEVETPLMCEAAIQDPHLHPIPTLYKPLGNNEDNAHTKLFYLQTSPEFAMKRMLAANVGPIYQLCKAFRNGERGRLHNPEFTMLEWYRPGFDHHKLMDEMEEFLKGILNISWCERITYQNLFLSRIQLDPFKASLQELENAANFHKIDINFQENSTANNNDLNKQDLNMDDWLNLLLTHVIEPSLGFNSPCMVYDFPPSQAALAKISMSSQTNNFRVAERFEVYMHGMELANGYHELTDPDLQLERFKKDFELRKMLKHPEIPIDYHLIEALKVGLPDCAGVALGVDRLLMVKMGIKNIDEVLAFPLEKA